MKLVRWALLASLLWCEMAVTTLFAEDSGGVNTSTQTAPSAGIPTETESGTSGDSAGAADVVALGARGIVALNELAGKGLLYGLSSTDGYGWTQNPALLANSQGPLSLLQPYLGYYLAAHRTKTLFQYLPAIDLFDGRHWDGSVFHDGTVDGLHSLTERWTWKYSGVAMNGPESVRQTASLANGDNNGEVNGLAYALPTSIITHVLGSTALAWSRTPTQEISFAVANSYTSVSNDGKVDTRSFYSQIASDVGENARWTAYAQVHNSSNQPGRVLIGLGGGYETALGKRTVLAVKGGPEIGAGGRGGRLQAFFDGSLREKLLSHTTAYLHAQRDLVVPYLVESRWVDNFSGRLRQDINRSVFLEASTTYVHGEDVFGGTEHYRGLLLGGEVRWRATETLTVISGYRYFERESPVPSPLDLRRWALCTLVWQPVTRGMRP